MLVLTRHHGERIIIKHPDGSEVVITAVKIKPDKVHLGFEAPTSIRIIREELLDDAA